MVGGRVDRLELTEKLHCGFDFEIAYLRSYLKPPKIWRLKY